LGKNGNNKLIIRLLPDIAPDFSGSEDKFCKTLIYNAVTNE